MLKPCCLGRRKFLSLCLDHSRCKAPYRAQSAHWAACPTGSLEPHSCRASLGVAALPSSGSAVQLEERLWRSGEGERTGLRGRREGVGVSYGCWQCLGLPLQHQSHITAFYQACTWPAGTSLWFHVSIAWLISAAHSIFPAGWEGTGRHACCLTMETDLSVSRWETFAARHMVQVGGCQVQGLEHPWDGI